MVPHQGEAEEGRGSQAPVTCDGAFELSKSLEQLIGFLFQEVILLIQENEMVLITFSPKTLLAPGSSLCPKLPDVSPSDDKVLPLCLFSIRRSQVEALTLSLPPAEFKM